MDIFLEMTLSGYLMNAEEMVESSKNSETLRFLDMTSKDYSVNIAFGTKFTRPKGSISSNALCLSAQHKEPEVIYEKNVSIQLSG